MHTRRPICVLALACAVALSCMAAAYSATAPIRVRAVGSTALQTATAVERNNELQQILSKSSLSAAARSRAVSEFARLSVEAQDVVLARLSPNYAARNDFAIVRDRFSLVDRIDPAVLFTPVISSLYPSKGAPSSTLIVSGNQFSPDCVVKFDGVERTTSYYMGMLICQVPQGQLGTTHNVTVKNKTKGYESTASSFKIAAPPGYRGKHGWKFQNFGSADLGWNVYRDYFTPAAVEYGNGSHRPSAQAWFDASYKHIGNGGCCYGFSLRSVRTRRGDYSGCYASWWPSNLQPTVWDYARIDPQILDCIREDQGGQLCAQSAALINDRWNHQTHLQAQQFIWGAVASNDTNRQPVMCMWIGNQAGHAVIAYNIAWDGSKYNISVYDNNKPYSETETGDNGSTAYISSNGQFSYVYGPGWPSANRMLAFSYNELVYPLPLLPASAGGTTGLAAGCTIVAFESGDAVKQITDENGRTFFANGQENTNQSTRIPESMRFVPMTGAKWPSTAPAFFIFNSSAGKSLSFDVAANAATTARIFSPKSVTSVNLQRGQFTLRNVMQATQELDLATANLSGLQDVQMISVQQDNSERVFQMRNFQNLTPGSLKFSLSSAADSLRASGIPARFNLNIQGASNSGIRNAAMSNVAIQQGRMTAVTVPSFANLQNSTLRLENR